MLKKLLVAAVAVIGVQATALNLNAVTKMVSTKVMSEVTPQGINWKVGDTADYKLNIGGFLEGTMKMYVREVTETELWLVQDIDVQIQKSKVEMLLDRETGAVKKILVDGKEQKQEDKAPPEIVESKGDTVTVPAGTFECSYLKLHDKEENTDTELWVNPELVPMLGLIKQAAESQFGPVTVELTGFTKG